MLNEKEVNWKLEVCDSETLHGFKVRSSTNLDLDLSTASLNEQTKERHGMVKRCDCQDGKLCQVELHLSINSLIHRNLKQEKGIWKKCIL